MPTEQQQIERVERGRPKAKFYSNKQNPRKKIHQDEKGEYEYLDLTYLQFFCLCTVYFI